MPRSVTGGHDGDAVQPAKGLHECMHNPPPASPSQLKSERVRRPNPGLPQQERSKAGGKSTAQKAVSEAHRQRERERDDGVTHAAKYNDRVSFQHTLSFTRFLYVSSDNKGGEERVDEKDD